MGNRIRCSGARVEWALRFPRQKVIVGRSSWIAPMEDFQVNFRIGIHENGKWTSDTAVLARGLNVFFCPELYPPSVAYGFCTHAGQAEAAAEQWDGVITYPKSFQDEDPDSEEVVY